MDDSVVLAYSVNDVNLSQASLILGMYMTTVQNNVFPCRIQYELLPYLIFPNKCVTNGYMTKQEGFDST